MKILYCNICEMRSYNGTKYDTPIGGGSYEDKHEVNNFTNHDSVYYGHAEPGGKKTFDIAKNFGCPRDAESADGILVVWVIRHKTVVGYYKNATVYRRQQYLPDDITPKRDHNDYNVTAREAVLIPPEERTCTVRSPKAQTSFWYGKSENYVEINAKVIKYIEEYDAKRKAEIAAVEQSAQPLAGKEREALVKERVNQGVFRARMLERYGSCCICSVTHAPLLIASHIKPWSVSDPNEKLSEHNGLLLCPNHDKLFDQGYISFDENGRIMISEQLDAENQAAMQICPDMQLGQAAQTDAVQAFLAYHRSEIFERWKKSTP